MSDPKNNGTPWWIAAIHVIGIPLFLLLWLMGAFDGWITSPVTAQMRDHDRAMSKYLRAICLGIWRDNPSECN